MRRKCFLGVDFGPALRRAGFCLCCPATGLLRGLGQVAQSCCPSLAMCKMKKILWPFSHTYLACSTFLVNFSRRKLCILFCFCRALSALCPYISPCSPIINVFPFSKVKAADFADCQKKAAYSEVCIFQGESQRNKANDIVPGPREEIVSV